MVGCEIIISSGVSSLDERVCSAVVRTSRFFPATDLTGNPVGAVIRERLVWKPVGAGRSEWFEAPDYVIEVPTLPRRARKFSSVVVAYQANGKAESCRVIISTGDVILDRQACGYAFFNHNSYPMFCIACDRKPVLRFLNFGFVHGASGSVQVR